jgi:HK97 family phage portal protein
MGFFDRITGRQAPVVVKASTHKPIVSSVTPGMAKTTPVDFNGLTREGYAMNVIAYRSVNMIANAVASIPLQVKRGDTILESHELLTLLQRPNPKAGGAAFVRDYVAMHQISGNAYMLGVGTASKVRELYVMRTDTIKVIEGADGLPTGYRQEVAGRKRDYEAADVLHWKTANPANDWYGMSPLQSAFHALDIHNEGSRWNLALIQNGAKPSGALVQKDSDATLSDRNFRKLQERLQDEYSGPSAAGRAMLLEGQYDWLEMGATPSDMDWRNSKTDAARDIALAYGVPPQMIGLPDSQTYSNYSEARQSFWEDTVIPLAEELIAELNYWLAPQFGAGIEIALDLDDVPALAPKRQKLFDNMRQADFMTINEKREKIGLEKIDGGDDILVNASMVPLGMEVDDTETDDPDAAAAAAFGEPDDDEG